MHVFTYCLTTLAGFSKIPLDTLRTWQRAQNRASHCALIESAYERTTKDPSAAALLVADDTLQNFAEQLGLPSPYPQRIGIPATTLRQWEKDGDGFRLRVMLLGYQTQQLRSALESAGGTLQTNPVPDAALMRLLLADPEATKTLLHQNFLKNSRNFQQKSLEKTLFLV